jgi:hypothetical protein
MYVCTERPRPQRAAGPVVQRAEVIRDRHGPARGERRGVEADDEAPGARLEVDQQHDVVTRIGAVHQGPLVDQRRRDEGRGRGLSGRRITAEVECDEAVVRGAPPPAGGAAQVALDVGERDTSPVGPAQRLPVGVVVADEQPALVEVMIDVRPVGGAVLDGPRALPGRGVVGGDDQRAAYAGPREQGMPDHEHLRRVCVHRVEAGLRRRTGPRVRRAVGAQVDRTVVWVLRGRRGQQHERPAEVQGRLLNEHLARRRRQLVCPHSFATARLAQDGDVGELGRR